MQLHEKLELVAINNEETKVTFILLDEPNQEVYKINWNLMEYDQKNQEWIESQVVEDRVEQFSRQVFGVPFADVEQVIGEEFDVYEYEKFNSFWKTATKFSKEQKGKSFDAIITSIEENPEVGIIVKYDIDNNTYTSKYNYTDWVSSLNKGFFNKDKMRRARDRFFNTFGTDNVDDLEQFIGRKIKVQVKAAGKDAVYGDIVAVI